MDEYYDDAEGRLRLMVAAGKEAEHTFNGFYNDFHKAMIDDLFAQYRAADDSDTLKMQLIKMQMRMADKFRDYLADTIDSGKRAEIVLIEDYLK